MANKTKEWVVQEIEESLKQCGLDYIDLYLIHGLVFRLSSGCRDSWLMVSCVIGLREERDRGQRRGKGAARQRTEDSSNLSEYRTFYPFYVS